MFKKVLFFVVLVILLGRIAGHAEDCPPDRSNAENTGRNISKAAPAGVLGRGRHIRK